MGAYRTNKLLVSLFAAQLGADPRGVGVVVSLYAPCMLAIYAGRLIDRMGMIGPMLFGTAGLIAVLLIPWAWPTLPALYVC